MKFRSSPILYKLSSLKLSVVLLALSLALVFFGTLDQVQYGIRETQQRYFESFIAFWSYPSVWPNAKYFSWFTLPLPGGYLLGPLFVINMGASLIRILRFKMKLFGVIFIHVGILLLIIGQLITQLMQKDYFMWLDEGETKNYVQSFHHDELVLIKKIDNKQSVFATLARDLDAGQVLNTEDRFPFRTEIIAFYPNTAIQPAQPGQSPSPATKGVGFEFNLLAQPIPVTYADNERNAPTALVRISDDTKVIGTWMVSNLFENRFGPQEFSYDGSIYEIAIRPQRDYLGFSLHLETFNHDKYPGTQIPRNFSSDVVLNDPQTQEERKVTISMNDPLRYGGKTFFQASFAKQDTASMFQVVENPGWLIPYISCILVSIGLVFQFTYSTIKYGAKHR